MSLDETAAEPKKRNWTRHPLPEALPFTDADVIMTGAEFCAAFRLSEGWDRRNRVLKNSKDAIDQIHVVPHFYVGRNARYVLSQCLEHFKTLPGRVAAFNASRVEPEQ